MAGWTKEEAFDWDKVNTEAPPPLEAGVYKALVVKAEPSEMGKDKNPGVKLELSAIEAFGKGALERPAKLFDNLILTAAAAFKVKQIGGSAGVTLPASSKFQDVEEFCNALVDSSHVYVRVKHETYEGKVRARVDRYFTEEQAAEAANAGSGAAAEPERPVRKKRGAT